MEPLGVAYWIQKTNTLEIIKNWPSKHSTANPVSTIVPEPIQNNLIDPSEPSTLQGVKSRYRTADSANTRPIEDKVPTRLEYPDPNDKNQKTLWGYLCANIGESSERKPKELFKFYLHDETRDNTYQHDLAAAPSLGDVQQWIADFIKEIDEHVATELKRRFSRYEWGSTNLEYHFSVPTTWPPDVNERFRMAIEMSKIGGGHNESRSIDLAEAEAAAVQIAADYTRELNEGDALIVCDAGGGTTDISAIEIYEKIGDVFRFRQPISPSGYSIGSVQIDFGFADLVNDYLRKNANEYFSDDEPGKGYPGELIANGEFQVNKKAFWKPTREPYTYKVKGLPENFERLEPDSNGITVKNGVMMVPYATIERLFDTQVGELHKAIRGQLEKLRGGKVGGRGDVRVALCGGLGSSEYVIDYLKSKFQGTNPPVTILVSKEPLLAVCKGLVTNRLLEIRDKIIPCASRRCPKSYGILYNGRYDHRSDEKYHKAIDGKRYMTDQVHWFIKEDEEYGRSRALHPFFRLVEYKRRVGAEEERYTWTDRIVESRRGHEGYRILYEVKTTLERELLHPRTEGVTKKKKAWYRRSDFLRLDYNIQPTITRTGFKVDVWFSGGVKSSSSEVKHHVTSEPISNMTEYRWDDLPMRES
ncbi:hypothetical protein AOQ84DRAFT_379510 [Glonium stellatum]|uniref:Uncharacterized protein n=1 Tax=Glonium stellatum TaxID=574774 RepID=A0A8E2JQ85_9PEZI|nr:hypothetical protein AOQ84DRAFT_379510 [Glonium stellatum]